MVQLQICDRKSQGTDTETEDPHQDDHPPAFAPTHDDRVPEIEHSQSKKYNKGYKAHLIAL